MCSCLGNYAQVEMKPKDIYLYLMAWPAIQITILQKKCCISQSKSVSRYMSCYLMFSSTLHCTKFAKVFKVSWKFVNQANLTIKATIYEQRMSYEMERKIWCFPAYAQKIKEIDSNMEVSWNNWWKESGDLRISVNCYKIKFTDIHLLNINVSKVVRFNYVTPFAFHESKVKRFPLELKWSI